MKMETNKIYNMDCLEGMKQLPDESVDLILTDPPYGINIAKNGSVGGGFLDGSDIDCNDTELYECIIKQVLTN